MVIEIKPKLNKILKERNMTQNELSIKTGITQPVISRFDKNGQHRSIHLYLISRALDLKIDDLFEVNANSENHTEKEDKLKNDSE